MLKLLEQLGLSFENLTKEERATYARWSEILGRPDPTIQDVLEWARKEGERADEILRDYDITEKKRIYYQATSRLVRVLTAILTAPGQEKEMLKKQIDQMLQK